MNRIITTMKSTLPEIGAAAAVGATSFSWIEATTQISMLVSAVIGIVVGIVAVWWNVERAMAARKERLYGKSSKE